tara:strand:- start:3014 stop:3715 length:702 start_codon:yes stop_codon:yes gene_type:complete
MVKRIKTEVSVSDVMAGPQGNKQITKKDNQEWMYPGGNIVRGDHLKKLTNHMGSAYRDHKDSSENRRRHESNFFITLNTNRAVHMFKDPNSLALGQKACQETLKYLAKDQQICRFLKFGPKHDEYKFDKYDDVIQSIDWKSAVEVGEKQNRLHCHIWLTVTHFSQVQVNMPMIGQLFKTHFNNQVGWNADLKMTRKCYVAVKLLPTSDWAMVFKQYIHKAMTTALPEDKQEDN